MNVRVPVPKMSFHAQNVYFVRATSLKTRLHIPPPYRLTSIVPMGMRGGGGGVLRAGQTYDTLDSAPRSESFVSWCQI